MYKIRLLSILLFLFAADAAWGKTVGLWKDRRSYITDGMLKTLQDEGWQTVILEGKDLSDEAKLAGLDVVFLPGGHNAYQYADFHARRQLTRFVASGKGILAGAFRGGYVRTANRPLFPEVGAVYNRVNSPWISASGDSPLAQAIDPPFSAGGWDHTVVKVGPLGRVFAVSGRDPVGVQGEVFGGRYLLFGAFIGMDAKTEPMQGSERRVLLAMLDWLASAPAPSAATKAGQQTQADLAFLRRERLLDWTLNERGPDRTPGILPAIRNRLAVPLQSRLYTLRYMGERLPGREQDQALLAIASLEEALKRLDQAFDQDMAEVVSRTAALSAEALAAERPCLASAQLLEQVERLTGKTEADKKAMAALLQQAAAPPAPAEAGKKIAEFLHGDAIRAKWTAAVKQEAHIAHADEVIARLRPALKAAKAQRLAREREQDRAGLPQLIEACAAPTAPARCEAARELGRIGAPEGEAALVRLLDDSDEDTRVQAVLSLGWMQSRAAVPALLAKVGGTDLRMRRRAVQALGQIGDPRAVPALTTAADSGDHWTAENAILALGWLKAKAAVPRLLKIVATSDREDARQRGLMLAAIRALGHIGDAAALPLLEKTAAEANDFPWPKRHRRRIANPYSTAQSLGLQGHAELAVASIRAGGRAKAGVVQADFLAAADKFYALTRRFNALAGRASLVRQKAFAEEPGSLAAFLWEAGFTGFHQAWGEQSADPAVYETLVNAASDFDLLWLDVMPEGGNRFGGRDVSSRYGVHGVAKPDAEVTLQHYQSVPAFHGFWYEETYPEMNVTAPEFEAWLTRRHGAAFRKKLGLAADLDLASTGWNTWSDTGGVGGGTNVYSGALKTEFLRFAGDKLLNSWQESQDWLSGLRKGCAFTYSISDAQPVKYPGVAGRAGGVIAANGPETYNAFGRFNAFFMEMHKDGEAWPAMSEFYNWYCPSPAHAERGFAQHLMHGECFYNFSLGHIFGQSSYDMWSWAPERWERARDVFVKARALREYVAVPESAANVGLVISELSILSFSPINYYVGGLRQLWMQHQSSLWTALNQCHAATDVIWAETLTPEKLARYRVLVLSDAKIVTDEQAALLREWVQTGGTLIASGATSLFDAAGARQPDYALADLFGLSYAGQGGIIDPAQSDTYLWKHGLPPVKAVAGLTAENLRTPAPVHRDIKPVISLGSYALSDEAPAFLPGLAIGTACDYDLPLGYDRVKAGAANVLAAFKDGDPAVTANDVGQGRCYFWTPQYPGLCHVSSDWEMYPNALDFWPNVCELLDAMIRGGLAHAGATLPVEVLGASTEVEVTLRQQPARNRMMVHLLNYDTRADHVKGPRLVVHPPKGRTVKRLFYPDTDTEVAFEVAENGTTAALRDFGVHDMLVVEWQ